MSLKKRAARTGAYAGLGYLGGLLLEMGIEYVTGIDFAEAVWSLAVTSGLVGAGLANRDLIEAASRQIERHFGVDPKLIDEDQWNEFQRLYPRMAEPLRKALQIG